VAASETTVPKPALATSTVKVEEKFASELWSWWASIAWILVPAAFALVAIAVWRFRAKSSATTISMKPVNSREAESPGTVVSKNVARDTVKVNVAQVKIASLPEEPQPVPKVVRAPVPSEPESKDFSPPEIHFELPELGEDAPETNHTASSMDASEPNAGQLTTDNPALRKVHELQSQYPDISRLTPRVDQPQRLLQQSVTVYEQGDGEFAKRLLAFAAYCSPNTEEYWLALLELLYREKLSRDYSFNADLFHEIHPESIHWNEVARIGYMLNPAEALFALAANWSHDPPVPGSWLPTTMDNCPPMARTGTFELPK
jgi:hypothetical protein